MEHASCSSRDEEQDAPPPLLAAEQYVSPLSADDVVALATSLRAHPLRGHRFRWKILKMWSGGAWLDKNFISKVQGEVLAACPHLADKDAYATVLALLLSCFDARRRQYLSVTCDDADDVDEEAVAALYTALEHPTCTVRELSIKGPSFGTRAAAASLGRFLNVNSTIAKLNIRHVDGFCDGPVWTAFSQALTSNATLEHLQLRTASYRIGYGRHVGATLADPHKLSALRTVKVLRTVKLYAEPQLVGPLQDISNCVEDVVSALREDMEGWGIMPKHNSTIIQLDLGLGGVQLPQGRALLVPLWQGLRTNTTLHTLTIGGRFVTCSESTELDALVKVTSAMDDADSHSLRAMLCTNRSLEKLNIIDSGIVCNASVFDQGLSQNNVLKELSINVNAPGAQALMAVLAAPVPAPATTSMLCLRLGNLLGRQGFPTPVALRDMLAFNKTLRELCLCEAPYSNDDWATIILPALSSNKSLERLNIEHCPGVDSELVYDALLELLDWNTQLTSISLRGTRLSRDGKDQDIYAVVTANKEYRDALKNVPIVVTSSCRLVLCGYPFAVKTTLLQTMLCAQSKDTQKLRNQKGRSGDNTLQQLSERSSVIDIQPLMTKDLTLWVWDFAGQREFHPLQDFIFPNGASIHASTAFVFTFNLVQHVHKMENVANASSNKQTHANEGETAVPTRVFLLVEIYMLKCRATSLTSTQTSCVDCHHTQG